jgi:hypothetical protein
MADEPNTQAVPAAFDMDALATKIGEATAAAAAKGTTAAIEGIAQRNRQQQQLDQQNRDRVAATQADPVASTVLGNEAVAGALRTVAIKADSGRDAAVFYATTPDAAKYSGVIEGRFNDLIARGIPVDRASIWNLVRGENLGTFVEAEIKRRDEEVKRASDAAVAQGSRGGAPNTQIVDAHELSAEDLAKALENVSF